MYSVMILYVDWQGKVEQEEKVEVDNLEQASIAGEYEVHAQGFHHYELTNIKVID